ncbi:MAG: S8 family serine peptidase, partial [Gemmataceae bacterium]|nr:S8 family serine peptidase [Gemmataceae bacterium]
MPRTLVLLAGLLAVPALAAPPAGVARPANADGVRRQIGLLPDYAAVPGLKNVTVAVLDSGFAGFDGKRPYLPGTAVLVDQYDRDFVRRADLGDPDFTKPLDPANPHGRIMAQLVWAMAGGDPAGPRFLLLNANGPTMFRRAVKYAVEQKADVILFSGTFEGAGNYDGRGPLAATVDEAVRAGVIWVNAAGNSGGRVYDGRLALREDGYAMFEGTPLPSALRLANRFDESAVTVTLTWNDYRDAEDAGTDKDLDLIVEDAAGKVVGQSKLRQVPAGKAAGEGESKNPRERVVLTDLPAVAVGSEYRIRVKAMGGAFGPRDRLRVLVTAAKDAPFPDPATGKMVQPVELLDATKGGEIYPPADHPGVLTVGDGSRASSVGPTADGRVKPDVVMPSSTARFSNGEESAGSSNAAAYFAGVAAVLRAKEPNLRADHLRAWVRRLDAGLPAARAAAPP